MDYASETDWAIMQHLHTGDGRTLLGHGEWWLDLEALLDGADWVIRALIRREHLRIKRTIPDVNHTTFHLDAFKPPSHIRRFFHRRVEKVSKEDRARGIEDLVWVELTVVDIRSFSTEEPRYQGITITGHYSEAKDNHGIATMLIAEIQEFDLCWFDFDGVNELVRDTIEIDRIVVDILSGGMGSCR